ncbi:MAG: substrate-binding domain-containing protein [Treponema sp.]|jgi:LacI family transcriptional regulator|nr:substrate-binding domain-containing protein [Treponema sp.]
METTRDGTNGKRVTIYTIAEKLGISSTTVYRALNNKTRISETTKEAVLSTAKELGFRPNSVAKSLARKPLHVAFVVSSGFPEFHRHFINGARQTENELRDYNVRVDYFSNQDENVFDDGASFVRTVLKKIAADSYDGLLFLGTGVDELDLIAGKGIPMATVLNDYAKDNRCFFIHYDGQTAGRLAGELLFWKLGKGARVALASGFEHIYMHRLIAGGFYEKCEELSLDVIGTLYNRDTRKIAYENTNTLLEEHPELQGIYVNSYNSSGVIRSIKERGLSGKIVLITSDINEELARYIVDGTVSASIYQNQYRQGRLGLRYLYNYISENQKIDDIISVNPEVIFKSNINRYQKEM